MEHLGELIYDGVWVGEESEIPNQNGLRSDVLEALRELAPPLIRWPGGCFADSYNWRDGIGPRDHRPTRVTSRWGVDEIETNAFGTHEFMELCQAIGAQPWLAGNVGSGSPRELAQWVEYCNFPRGTTLSDERISNGASEPFGVKYWGIGNENWDCGGKFTPETYADHYRQFESMVPRYVNQEPFLIACGPDGNNAGESARWTRRVLERLDTWRRPRLHGLDAHFYTWNTKREFGGVTEFSLDEYYGLLQESLKIGVLIDEQRAILDASPIGRDAKLILGEWGIWHAEEEVDGKSRGFFQQNTLRDAISAALTLDLFARKADKVEIATLAQTVNVLQSLLLTNGSQMVKTPTYHVFSLYQGHRGGEVIADEWETGEAGGLPRLSGSASVKDNVLTLSVVNTGARSPVEAQIRVNAVSVEAVAAFSLSSTSLSACNTWDEPENVAPHAVEVTPDGDGWTHLFPPASVTVFEVKLGM